MNTQTAERRPPSRDGLAPDLTGYSHMSRTALPRVRAVRVSIYKAISPCSFLNKTSQEARASIDGAEHWCKYKDQK
jgi:hypothetical protein